VDLLKYCIEFTVHQNGFYIFVLKSARDAIPNKSPTFKKGDLGGYKILLFFRSTIISIVVD